MLVLMRHTFQEDMLEDMLHVLLLSTNTVTEELFKTFKEYISGKLNWSFCGGIVWMEQLPRLDDFLISLLESKRSLLNVGLCTVSSVEKCWLAKNCHLKLTTFYKMRLKLSATLEYMPLTRYLPSTGTALQGDGHSTHTSSLIHRNEMSF